MRHLLSALAPLALLAAFAAPAVAQTPGLIYSPANATGRAVMDPNGDGFTSKTTAGFTVNNMSGSEIPFHAIPQLTSEPTSDLRTGPPNGHTDLIEDETGAHSFLFNDGTNLLFRMLMAGQSTASKGYTFLFVTDIDSFGSYGPFNPGFDFEVVLETNFRVAVYAFNKVAQTSTRILTLDLETHFQKSISYVHTGGKTGYFYDWYVPMAALTAALDGAGITFNSSTPFQVATTTITRAQNGVTGSPLSDFGGVDDSYKDFYNAMTAVINSFPPATVDDMEEGGPGFPAPPEFTQAPLIKSPLLDGDEVIQGTLNEAPGATIFVYIDGDFVGTATLQADFTWELDLSALAVPLVLASGQEVTAYAQVGVKELSPVSNKVVVGAPAEVPISCVEQRHSMLSSPPVITTLTNAGGNNGSGAGPRVQVIAGSLPGLNQYVTDGGTLNDLGFVIYEEGTAVVATLRSNSNGALARVPTNVFGNATLPTIVKGAGDTFTITLGTSSGGEHGGLRNNGDYNGYYEVVFYDSTGSQPCQGERSGRFRTDTLPTTSPQITTDPIFEGGAVSVTVQNKHNAAVTLFLYINDALAAVHPPSNSSPALDVAADDGDPFTTTDTYTFTDLDLSAGDLVYARAEAASRGLSAYDVAVVQSIPPPPVQSAAPVITGTYVAGDTLITGTSSEAAGTIISVYEAEDPVNPVGTAVVDEFGNWELVVPALTTGQQFYATAEAPGKTVSAPSNTVTVLGGVSTTPVLNGDYTISSNAFSVTVPIGPIGIITVYVDGIAIGTYDASGETPGDSFTIDGSNLDVSPTEVADEIDPNYISNELYKGATITVTNTSTGLAESPESNEKVVIGVDYFTVVLATPGPKEAGECFEVIITAFDQNGNVFTDFTGQVLMYSDEVLFHPDTRVTEPFVDGQSIASTCITALFGDDNVRIRVFDIADPSTTGISDPFVINNPQNLELNHLIPDEKYAGEPGFWLTLKGKDFVYTSVVRLEGGLENVGDFSGGTAVDPADVIFIDFETLQVWVPAELIDTRDRFLGVTVQNPPPLGTGVPTAPLFLPVLPPPSPTITEIGPDTGKACEIIEVTVKGTGFIQGVTVLTFTDPAITVVPGSIVVTTPYDPDDPTAETVLTATIEIGCGAAGDYTPRVTNPQADVPSADLTDGFTVSAADFTQYVITLPGETFVNGVGNDDSPNAQTAGVPFTIEIRATDGGNNLYTDFTGTVDLSALFGPIAPIISGDFTSPSPGIWTGQVTLTTADSGQQILAVNSDGLQTGASSTFALNPGPGTKYLVASSSLSPLVGTDVTITAQLADAYNNPVGAVRTGTWSFTGAGGNFSGDPTAPFTTGANGIATVDFTVSGVAGTQHRVSALDTVGAFGQSPIITTVAAPSGIDATKLLVRLPGESLDAGDLAAGTITILGSPTDRTAGQPFNVTAIYAVDADNKIDVDYNGSKTITWGGAGGTPSFTTSVFFVNGVSTTNLSTLLTLAENNIQLTVDDGDLSGISSPFDVVGGAAVAVKLTGPATETAGEVSDLWTLRTVDSYGNDAGNLPQNTVFNLVSTEAGTATFHEAAGPPHDPLADPAQVTISAGQNSTTFRYANTLAGLKAVTATWDSGGIALGGDTHAIDITAGPPAAILITEGPTTVEAGVASSDFTISVVDAHGNPTNVSASTQINLSSNSTGTVNFGPSDTVTIANGSSSTTFTYTDTKAGNHTVTATVDAASDADGIDGQSTTAPIEVTAAAAFRLALIPPDPAETEAGVSSDEITLQIQDQYGNPVVAGVGGLLVTLTLESGTGDLRDGADDPIDEDLDEPGIQITIPEGESSITFHYYDTTAGDHKITASAPGYEDGETTITVLAGPVDHFVLIDPVLTTFTAGDSSGIVTIQLRDEYGNPAPAPVGGFCFTLTSDSTTPGEFRTADDSAVLVDGEICIAEGETEAEFRYRDTTAGTHKITVTEDSATLDSQETELTTLAGAPADILITAGPTSVVAGVESTDFTITVVDAHGNPTTVTGDVTIGLITDPVGIDPTFTGGGEVTIGAGLGSTTFTYSNKQAGDYDLTATVTANDHADDDALLSKEATAPITVLAAAPATFELTGPATAAVDTPSAPITITLYDDFGNVALAPPGGVTFDLTDSATGVFNPTPTVTVLAGESTATFTYQDDSTGDRDLTVTFDSGDVVDLGAKIHEITITAAGAPIANLSGSALNFGGTAYGQTTLSEPAGTYQEALTIEVWIRRDAVVTPIPDESILAKGDDWALRLNGDTGELEFHTKGLSNSVLAVDGAGIFNGTFHHVAAVYDSVTETKRIYVDGVLVGEETDVTGTLEDDDSLFRIAANGDVVADELWNGAINEVRVWNVVRDEGQIEALKDTILNGYEFGLVHYWRLNEGTGTLTADQLGTGDDVELFGSPQWFEPDDSVDRLRALSGMDIEIQLAGFDTGGGPVTAFITELPTQGTLYQRLPNGDRGDPLVLVGGEAEVTDPLGRVIYAAPDARVTDQHLEDFGPLGPDFTTFDYIVKSGAVPSDFETVTIDLETVNILGGTAVYLDRNLSQYVMTPNLQGGFLDTAVTIEVWFMADGDGVLVSELGQNIIDRGWQNSQIEVVDVGGGQGEVRVRVWNIPEATSAALTTGLTLGNINYGEWHHAVVRYNPASRRLDGALNGVVSAAHFTGDRQAPYETIVVDQWNQASRPGLFYAFGPRDLQHLGSGFPAPLTRYNNHFTGAIDEVRIWNEAIPDDRIGKEYTEFVDGEADRLVALYRFDEPSGTLVRDATPNGFNATIINGGTRVRSEANLNLISVSWGQEKVVEIPGYDDGNGGTNTATITRMPLFGALYQYDGGNQGARISNVPTEVTDARRRVIFVPATGSRFDSIEYFTKGDGDQFGTRRLRFRVDRDNDPPVFAAVPSQNPLADKATEGQPLTITFQAIVDALGADPNGGSLTFRIERILLGELTKGGDPVVPGVTLMADGDELEWTPPPYVFGDDQPVFVVRAYDGRDFSENSAIVRVDIEGVDSAPVAEYPGPALRFGGTNSYVYTPNLRPLFRTDNVTIEVWFRADGPGVLVTERGRANATGWTNSQIEVTDFDPGVSGTVRVAVWELERPGGLDLGVVEYGTWNHVVVRYDEANLRLDGFLNGDRVISSTFAERTPPWAGGFTGLFYGFGLGDPTHLGSGAYFKGVISEVRLWNIARSTPAILASLPDNLTGDELGLAAWYRFDNGTGTKVTDHGPYRPGGVLGPTPALPNLDANLINSPVWVDNRPTTLPDTPIMIRLQGFHPDDLPFDFRIETVPANGGTLHQWDAGVPGDPISAGELVTDPEGRIFYVPDDTATLDYDDPFEYVAVDVAPRNLESDPAEVNVRVVMDPEFLVLLTGGGESAGVDPRPLHEIVRITSMATVTSADPVFSGILFMGVDPDGSASSNPRLRLEFLIDRSHGFIVEYSDDLINWHPVADVYIDDDRSTLEDLAVVAEVDANSGRRFVRVRVGM